MRTVVRPLCDDPIAAFTLASVARSRFEVASSSRRIAGSTELGASEAKELALPDGE